MVPSAGEVVESVGLELALVYDRTLNVIDKPVTSRRLATSEPIVCPLLYEVYPDGQVTEGVVVGVVLVELVEEVVTVVVGVFVGVVVAVSFGVVVGASVHGIVVVIVTVDPEPVLVMVTTSSL
jgi:hypothetical protein